MKIGIDARMFGPAHSGLGRYVGELLTELQAVDQTNHYVVFLNEEGFANFEPTNPHFEKRLACVRWYTILEQLKMPNIIDRESCDLVHFPHWNVPLRLKTPFVVTVHDLILLSQKSSAHRATTLPSPLYKLKYQGYKLVLRHALSKSKRVIAVTNFVKEDILRHFHSIRPSKISVIYEGTTDMPNTGSGKNDLVPYGQYFLYVGNAFPHKNLESLLHAFSMFHKLHPEVKLVLVGKTDYFYKRLHKEIDEIDIPRESVIFTGFVPDEELAGLYKNATLYVFPSRAEGFGLPPLEAMAHGVPVAASRTTSLPEVLGDAALYFDPDDIEEMIEVMERALTDKPLRDSMTKEGHEQIKKYSWKKMAKEIVAIYESNG